MAGRSSIERLPEQVRAEIGRLLQSGVTLDELMAHLRTLATRGVVVQMPSRSALGRHAQKIAKVGEQIRRSRTVAEALARELGDAPESQAARVNIEALHSTVLDLFLKASDGEDVDEGGKSALAGNPMGLMMLAKTMESLTRASKTNVDFVVGVERRAAEKARKEAADRVEEIVKERGMTAETAAAIKAGIFGVRG